MVENIHESLRQCVKVLISSRRSVSFLLHAYLVLQMHFQQMYFRASSQFETLIDLNRFKIRHFLRR